MQHETRVALEGLRLKSKASDIRSLPFAGTGMATDGNAVAITATGETCKAVASGDTDFGIVVFQNIGKSGRTADKKAEAYVEFDVVPVMTEGRIWVRPAEPVTTRGKDAKVYVTPTGQLSATAAGNTEFKGAYWDVPTNDDGLAVVSLV